ncbi:hypothetical protein FRC12_010649 [Ceratobasidium sp. 428]|nr:hypothetical protein FRC12_010649 [Ceratobasidium sp. 428]
MAAESNYLYPTDPLDPRLPSGWDVRVYHTMYRAPSTGNRRRETELSLQYKERGGRQYRCIICPTRPVFSSFYEALQHESKIEHIGSRRDFDRPAPRPVTIARQSAAPPAFRPSLGVFQPSDYLYTPSSSTSLCDAPLSNLHAAPRPSGGGSHSNIAGDSWHSDLQAYSRSPEAYFAIPGPALPSDPPDTVYGLCGGAADHDNDPLSDEEEPLNIGGIYSSERPHTGDQAHTAMHPAAQLPSSGLSHSIQRPKLIGVPKGAPLAKIKVPDFDSQVWWPFKSREASACMF